MSEEEENNAQQKVKRVARPAPAKSKPLKPAKQPKIGAEE